VKVRELIEVELAKQGVSGYKLEWYRDSDWGYVYVVKVGLNARRALEIVRSSSTKDFLFKPGDTYDFIEKL
jgi:hypothetical protein